ncbi:D-alanyl-D-alanine carboxypeptidase/D-alanyl-D-alanine endopeptidase [Haloferula sp.]|uniref:D-alanyl-D-alanine carboxypeptidase/D-alanyl-D-alanine endopeptidase n=1 Tax=Haloferula sp. TaxID=2497595 RepID=UPI003C70CB79
MRNVLTVLLSLALAGSLWMLAGKAPDQSPGVTEIGELPSPDPLADVLAAMREELPGVSIGFCLMDKDGKVLSEMNGDMPMIPASTFKTLTTVAALDLLGPEFRFATRLVSEEPLDGRIAGDLGILGGGNPMLSMEDLEGIADRLKEEGLWRIDGGVVGDGSLFPASMAGDFWGWGDVGNGYGSPVSGLNLEHNRFVAVFRPNGTVGEPAEFVGARPEVPGVTWLNQVMTGAAGSGDGVMIYGGPRATRILLTGTVPQGAAFGVGGAVPDPAEFAAFHLHRLLVERGITIAGSPRAGTAKGSHLWLNHLSPTVAEILPGLHGRSDNHETECLFQMLGVKEGGAAAEVLSEYWNERGIERLRVVDGSGLSRADFVSAQGLARVQWLALQQAGGEIYRNSLSAAHGGAVLWKGGAMSSVRSWTGYVESGSGEVLGFGLIFNHYLDGSELDAWRDRLLEAAMGL